MTDLRDKIARALNIEGAFCGTCDREPGDSLYCKTCELVLNGYAVAVLAVLDLDTIRAEAQVEALRQFRRELIAHQLESYGVILPDVHGVLDDLDETADRISREAGIETKEANDD